MIGDQTDLLYRAYVRLIAGDFPGKVAMNDGQALLCAIRERIARQRAINEQEVQLEAEYDAALLRGRYKPEGR